jgi:hypothetical protein
MRRSGSSEESRQHIRGCCEVVLALQRDKEVNAEVRAAIAALKKVASAATG